MHEFSIALGIIETASEELQRAGGGRVRAVHVVVGALSGVSPDSLLAAYELACPGTGLAGSTLQVVVEPATIQCGACGSEQEATGITDVRCGRCGGPPGSLLRGRSLMVTALEIDT